MTREKLVIVGLVLLCIACTMQGTTGSTLDEMDRKTGAGSFPDRVLHPQPVKKPAPEFPDLEPARLPVVRDAGLDNVPEGYAVLAGVSNYPGTANDLQYCDDDVNDVYNLALNTFHIPASNIVRLVDSQATTSAITSAISNFASIMDADDTLFFYFSGHGSTAQQVITHTWNVQSAHPYSNNLDLYWHFSVPGVQRMRVHFVRVDTEYNYDYVFVGDNNNRNEFWDYFTGGPVYDIWSSWVDTDDIYVNLYTDYIYTDWGFQVDKVETATWISPQEFIPYDGLYNGFTGPELDALFDTVPGKVIMVMDTCHSGGVGSAIQATNRYAMTACQWDEYSLEDPSAANGVFTRYFLQPWGASYDANNDGVVSFEETFSFISTNTISRSTTMGSVHHPQQFDGVSGSTIFQPNAKINSHTVDGSSTTNVNFYLNGLGHGELYCAYYDKVTQTYRLQRNDTSILPSASAFSWAIPAPGGGFTTSAVTTRLAARYHGYAEKVNSSVNLSGPAFSSGMDSDGDGVNDLMEYYLGTNMWAMDTDGDGMRDDYELQYGLNPYVDDSGDDLDGDGIPNLAELLNGLNPSVSNLYTDRDGDGLYDAIEYAINSNMSNPDTDGDGMHDGWEYTHNPWVDLFVPDATGDPDGDGLTNLQEFQYLSNPGSSDTDGDGMPDGWEHLYGLNLIVNDANADKDGDGATNLQEFTAGSNATNLDTDGDGMRDGWEITHAPVVNVLVPDAGADPDGDGLTNLQEFQYLSNPGSSDTDGDGMPDGWEHLYGLNLIVNDANADKDGDGATNLQEFTAGSNATNIDTDGDGMRDGWEIMHAPVVNVLVPDAGGDPDGDGLTNLQEFQHLSNPGSSDTDGDGMPDGWEHLYGLNLIVNDANADKDGDGATNLQEFTAGSNATNVDTDGDGMRDGWEITHAPVVNVLVPDAGADPDGDGLTNLQEFQHLSNPGSSDTDGDGMPDGWEHLYGLNLIVNDANADKDGDGATNLQEFTAGSNATNLDTDGDGMRDGWEITHAPVVNVLVPDAGADPDGDGLTNLQEFQLFSNPGSSDTDGDGMPDGWEHVHGLLLTFDDANGDLDHDRLVNLLEYQQGSDPNNPDTDGDLLDDYLEYLLGSSPVKRDSDLDGFPDYLEYTFGSDPGNMFDTPFLHLFAFIMIVVVVLVSMNLATRLASKRPGPRPRAPGSRPEKPKRSPAPSPVPPRQVAYSPPRSPGVSIVLPPEVQLRLNRLAPHERELVLALIMQKLKEIQNMERRSSMQPPVYRFCTRCGGPLLNGTCRRCGYSVPRT